MKRPTSQLFTLVAIALFAAATSSQAATVNFQEGVAPSGAYAHDATYIRSTDPSGNNDGDPDLELIVGTTLTGDVVRTLLEFDISTIPAADNIDSASLVLTTRSTGGGLDQGGETGDPTFNLHNYGFDVVETVSTWDDPDGDGSGATGDATDGGTLGTLLGSVSFNVTTTGLTVTFADSAAFRTAVANALAGDGFLRMILVKDDESTVGTHEFARFAADNFGTTADRPELIITHSESVAIPAPAALPAGLALLGLIAARRRRA